MEFRFLKGYLLVGGDRDCEGREGVGASADWVYGLDGVGGEGVAVEEVMKRGLVSDDVAFSSSANECVEGL